MHPQAIQYFYPDGFWCGYTKWFSPCINSNTGDMLISNVRKALQGSEKHRLAALFILQSIHTKKVNPPGAKPPFSEVLCHPTEEAKKAAQMLAQW